MEKAKPFSCIRSTSEKKRVKKADAKHKLTSKLSAGLFLSKRNCEILLGVVEATIANITNNSAPGIMVDFSKHILLSDSWYSRTYAWSKPRGMLKTQRLITVCSIDIRPISSTE
ncbi:hypothetical protein D3C84_319930 [compost metagenome]